MRQQNSDVGLSLALSLVFFWGTAALCDELIINNDSQFFSQVLEAVKNFGGIPWTLKAASIVTLIISSMKVSFLRPFWDKLGWIKAILAPILGLSGGILLLSKDHSLTMPGVFAYMFAGAGAIVLHEMLDGMKQIPGIGSTYVSVIQFLQNILKAPKQPEVK